jgi:hypothetical protein
MQLTDWISRADALLCELDELPDDLAAQEVAELKKLVKYLPWDPDLAPEIDMRLAELDNAKFDSAGETIAAPQELSVPPPTAEVSFSISAEKKFDAFVAMVQTLVQAAGVPHWVGTTEAYRATVLENIIADAQKIVDLGVKKYCK